MFKKQSVLFLVVLVLISLLLVGCMPDTQTTDNGLVVNKVQDTQLYHVYMLVESGDQYSSLRGESGGVFINGTGNFSSSIWEDGKGMVRGILVEVEPEPQWVSNILNEVDNPIFIVKTTDRKATMGKGGDLLHLVCTTDYEPT